MATIPVVNSIDRRKGIISGVIAVLLLILYVLLTSFEIADPPPQDVLVEVDTQLPEELVLENLVVEGGSGGGEASNDPVDQPKPQTQEVLTGNNENTVTNTGQSSHTNSPNSSETNTTTTQSNDPFASGGNGTGTDGGDGNTFGNDSGTGTNGTSGSGTGTGRVRLNDPVIKDLKHSSDEYIYLKLTIDGQGNVIRAYNIKAKTTTTDQKLINRVIYEVKKQVKYNKNPGAAPTNVYLPAVYIKAQ